MRPARVTSQVLLLLTALAVAGILGEAAVRLTLPRPLPSSLIMYSSPHFILDQRGAVRQIPNETVRLVSTYDDTIEFDTVLRTNGLGLIDHRDYPVGASSRLHYAFVGDSFTYGMGAEPWVPQLRDALRASGHDLEIYNLGVNGASLQHFRTLLLSVAAELSLTHIVLIPISNDFYRPWWVPIDTRDGRWMCRDPPACQNRRPMPPLIELDATASEIIEQHRALRAENARRQPVEPLWKRALWRSHVYLAAHRGARRLVQRFTPTEPDPSNLEDRRLLGPNLEALAGIRRDFPELPITLAHFPQIEEVRSGRYDVELAADATTLGIEYFPALTRCSWSVDMYHAVNAHPNERGYDNFARCLSRHLWTRE